MGCHFLLQKIFPTQGSNPGLPHCRQMLYHLSHQKNNVSIELNYRTLGVAKLLGWGGASTYLLARSV